MTQGAWLRQYIDNFHSSVHSFLSISFPSAISVPPSLQLANYLHLPQHILSQKKLLKKEKCNEQFTAFCAYLWEHHLLFLLYLAEIEYIE
jgi:hypothetical protein